jgi:osmotically-inducible protein OsmY
MKLTLVFTIFCCFTLSGCAGLMVAGAATGASASQDRRTVPTQLEDQNIELKTATAIFQNDELWKDTNIDVISYNTNVLLIGQAPTASLKDKAEAEVKKIPKVSKVYNQIRIAAPISFFARRNDEYLTSKVKSSMLFSENFPSGKIKVVTENNEVFLLGLVTESEAEKAVEIARNIDGVSRVIKVFEIIQLEE